jgi:hypothetical protein
VSRLWFESTPGSQTLFSTTPAKLIPPTSRISIGTVSWHNGAGIEIDSLIESLRRSAKLLTGNLRSAEDAKTAWDGAPVMVLYRQAAELSMKSLIGEGCVFQKSPADHITLAKTHSLRWLAQIVSQIIRAVEWEAEFTCEGVSNLAAFSALIAELEELEPVSAAILADKRRGLREVPSKLRHHHVLELAPRMDALIDLLMKMADALAATAEQAASNGGQ